MLKISIPKPPIVYEEMTKEEWSVYPKDGFDSFIRRWCERHGFFQYVALGTKVPAKLPYRMKIKSPTIVEVATDFLQIVETHRAKEIFKA